MPLMSEKPMQPIFTTKREKVKGHYRLVTRNEKGQIVSSTRWSPKKSILDKYYTLVKDDDGDESYLIDHAECDNCIPVDGHTAMVTDKSKDIPIQWFCLGLIPYLENPKDHHDEINRIRCCVITTHNNTIFSNAWTPWEAHRFGEALINASGAFLQEHQPGTMWDELQKMLSEYDLKTEDSKE